MLEHMIVTKKETYLQLRHCQIIMMDFHRLDLFTLFFVSLWYFGCVFGTFNFSLTTIANIHDDVVLRCPISENISITERKWKFGRKLLFAGKFPVNPGIIQMNIDRNYSLVVQNISLLNVGIYVCSDNHSKINVEHLLLVHGEFCLPKLIRRLWLQY